MSEKEYDKLVSELKKIITKIVRIYKRNLDEKIVATIKLDPSNTVRISYPYNVVYDLRDVMDDADIEHITSGLLSKNHDASHEFLFYLTHDNPELFKPLEDSFDKRNVEIKALCEQVIKLIKATSYFGVADWYDILEVMDIDNLSADMCLNELLRWANIRVFDGTYVSLDGESWSHLSEEMDTVKFLQQSNLHNGEEFYIRLGKNGRPQKNRIVSTVVYEPVK